MPRLVAPRAPGARGRQPAGPAAQLPLGRTAPSGIDIVLYLGRTPPMTTAHPPRLRRSLLIVGSAVLLLVTGVIGAAGQAAAGVGVAGAAQPLAIGVPADDP